MKREAQAKPYDSKKSVWCPDGAGGFSEAMLESDDGKKATVMVGHEVKLVHFFGKYSNIDQFYRKRPSNPRRLDKSTLQSLRNARTWPT